MEWSKILLQRSGGSSRHTLIPKCQKRLIANDSKTTWCKPQAYQTFVLRSQFIQDKLRFKAHQHCLQSSDTKAVSIFYYTAYGSYRGWKQLKPRKEFVLFYKKKKKAKQQPSSSICWCFSNSFWTTVELHGTEEEKTLYEEFSWGLVTIKQNIEYRQPVSFRFPPFM